MHDAAPAGAGEHPFLANSRILWQCTSRLRMTVVVPRILIEARRWKIGASIAAAANSRHPEYEVRRILATAMIRLSTSDILCFLVFIVLDIVTSLV